MYRSRLITKWSLRGSGQVAMDVKVSRQIALEMEAEWEHYDRGYTDPKQGLTDPPGREHYLTLDCLLLLQ